MLTLAIQGGIPHIGGEAGPAGNILAAIFLIFLSAKIAAEVCEWIRVPAVVGEIMAGILIGPGILGWVHPSLETHILGEMGVIFLLFLVGLETDPRSLFRIGKAAFFVATGGVVFPFAAGFLLFAALGYTAFESIFVGAAMVATSVGITARVLGSLGVIDLPVSRLILAAAVIDDILGLLFLGVINGLSKGRVDYLQLGFVLASSIGFILVVLLIGGKLARRAKPAIERLKMDEGFFIVGVGVCLGLSALGVYVGVAAIIGAFLAGLILSDIANGTTLQQRAKTLMEFTVPFFLVGIGLNLDASQFAHPMFIGLVLLTTLIAGATKVIGCGFFPFIQGDRKQALQVGAGMIPRGEVGIIVAQLGLAVGILGQSLYALIVGMAVLTTLVTPPLLVRLFRKDDAQTDSVPHDETTGYSEIG
jgi:Kef-type K+ transport system membrane component KefB